MTNEQAIQEIEKNIISIKQEYIDFLGPVARKFAENDESPTQTEFLKCQQLGNKYFNYLENFVGNSGLLGAHKNGFWITGFAETCYSVLEAYIAHIIFLKSHHDIFKKPIKIEPSKHSLANLQRLVKEYLPNEEVKELEKKFEDSNLPMKGFIMAAHRDKVTTPKWQIITSVIIGIFAVAGILILSILLPEPTEWQGFVFRGILAIGLAAIASIVPGFINLNTRIKGVGGYFSIVAGGAIAIFILIWLINPPIINQIDSNSEQILEKPIGK